MKGQFTMQGLFLLFITVIIAAALSPTLYTYISYVVANATANNDTATAAITPLIMVVLWGSILAIPVAYGLAGRSRYEG